MRFTNEMNILIDKKEQYLAKQLGIKSEELSYLMGLELFHLKKTIIHFKVGMYGEITGHLASSFIPLEEKELKIFLDAMETIKKFTEISANMRDYINLMP
jgi:hypothetical protein